LIVSIILGHPDAKSFNHAIAATVAQALADMDCQVRLHDLCAEGFDPVLPAAEIARGAVLPPLVERHCKEIREADGLVLVHPNWWGMPPAVMKGWIDRVLRPGVAYEFLEGDAGEGVPSGLLQAKAVFVYNTSNTESERETKIFGDPLATIWKNCIFGLCGIANFRRRMFNVMVTSSKTQRKKWLDLVGRDMDHFFSRRKHGGSSPSRQ